jgi:hypothetical protein
MFLALSALRFRSLTHAAPKIATAVTEIRIFLARAFESRGAQA